jgi:hypothetical protein
MKLITAMLVAFSFSAGALAAPPPGHPSPAQAQEMLAPERLRTPDNLPNEGKIVSAINANEYTYMEIDSGHGKEWLAASLNDLKPGTMVRYDQGVIMSNFYSKLLKRTFPQVMFVNFVVPSRK